jgi:hypothetical protein
MEQLPRRYFSREDMQKRVARFKDLEGSDGGLPDSKMPGCERTLFNVIGFQPPKGSGGAVTSPVGDQAAQLAAIKISEGFNLGYCKAKPGHGPEMHNHDTNETFIPMTGTWRASWENEKGEVEFVDLGPLDVVSFPPGMIRRFENVTTGRSERGIDPDVRDRWRWPPCGVHGSGDGALAEGGSLVARTGLEGAGHDCRDVDWRTGSGDGRDLCRRGRLCQRRRTTRAAEARHESPFD